MTGLKGTYLQISVMYFFGWWRGGEWKNEYMYSGISVGGTFEEYLLIVLTYHHAVAPHVYILDET